MASGSLGRPNSDSKVFNFGSDDILCSYEDYGVQDTSSAIQSDPSIRSVPSKEFHKNRMAKSSVFPTTAYSPQEDSFGQEVIVTVEQTMKKYADNLMRFLEGISSRMSQLELYCYNLDKSICEMRSDLGNNHGEADAKLKSLEKHIQEVHRSVQILRDKQELGETQRELAKLQLAHKESSPPSQSQHSEEKKTPPTPDTKNTDSTPSPNIQDLALALSHQPSLPTRPIDHQPQPYYLPPPVSHVLPGHRLPQYPPQWAPQIPQNTPMTAPSNHSYHSQPQNPTIPETPSNSFHIVGSFSGVPQPGSVHSGSMPYGYGGPHNTMSSVNHSNNGGYMMYEPEGARVPNPHQSSYYQSQGISPVSSSNVTVRNPSQPQFVRNNPYNELIEKLGSMGYRSDHVVSVIRRMEETGQPVDFNSVLDRLSSHSSGGSHQRAGW